MCCLLPRAQVESAEDAASRTLKPSQLEEYARGLFEYKEIQIKAFEKWADKRK